jgi:hypothetical protein
MGLFELANKIAVLSGGRSPAWTMASYPDSFSAIPSTLGDGVGLTGSLRTFMMLSPRFIPHSRRADVTVPGFDAGEVYTVEINGNAVNYDSTGDVDAAETVQGIADAINADGTVNLIVVAGAVDTDGDGDVDTIRIFGLSEADYAIDISTSGGSATLACQADTQDAIVDIYALPEGTAATILDRPGWRAVNGGVDLGVDRRGWADTLDTGGVSRLTAHVTATTPVPLDGGTIEQRVWISIGPGEEGKN